MLDNYLFKFTYLHTTCNVVLVMSTSSIQLIRFSIYLFLST